MDALAEDRIQRRADRQRQPLAKAEIGQRHAHQGVYAPTGQPPVQEGQLHGVACRLGGAALTYRRLEKLGDRLGDAEEQQVDADPGGKQHRRPSHHIEFGFGVIRPEADLAVTTGGDDHHEQQVQQHGEKVEPAEAVGYPAEYRVDDRQRAIGEEHRPYGEYHDGDGGTVEHYGIDSISGRFGIIRRELSLVHQFYLLNLFWLYDIAVRRIAAGSVQFHGNCAGLMAGRACKTCCADDSHTLRRQERRQNKSVDLLRSDEISEASYTINANPANKPNHPQPARCRPAPSLPRRSATRSSEPVSIAAWLRLHFQRYGRWLMIGPA